MNLKFLLFILSAAVFSSCSSSYRNGQTPDDVYYSPVKAVEEDTRQEEEYSRTTVHAAEDRQIRMSRYDRRWRDFDDDYNCRYDPYRYGYSYGYYYNPYYYPSPVYISGYPVINPKNTTPRMTSLGSYNYTNMVVVNPKSGPSQVIKSQRRYNNSNNSSYIRRVITPSNNNNSYNPSDNNTRSYTPSNSPSSGGNRGSGTPVTRPGRGG